MKNFYKVYLHNSDCVFDSNYFSNLKVAKKWASGRNGKYKVEIIKNDIPFQTYYAR